MRYIILKSLKKCKLCARECGIDRTKYTGYCGASDKIKIALVNLHKFEEPCLIGENGAGTIFFSHCNLRCVFCQNYQISQLGFGLEVTIERLADIFIEQQKRGAANIELVTPTHFVPQIIHALEIAKSHGLTLPIVYNTNSYESAETIDMLNGYVDVFLPDLKYFDDSIAIEYSNAPNYFNIAVSNIKKMIDLTGKVIFNDKGQLIRGVLVRHLVLPNHRHDSFKIVDYLHQTFGNDIYISLMNQYTPLYLASNYKKISRHLTTFEYNSVINHALDIGISNAFMQIGKTASVDFVPIFNGENVVKE